MDKILSISAITISTLTFIVYLYQSSIMNQQKYYSVWPYVEWGRKYSEIDGFLIQIKNKGIGPALITSEEFRLADSVISNNEIENILKTLSKNKNDIIIDYTYVSLAGRVLAPGETVTRLRIHNPYQSRAMDSLLFANNFTYKINYCSVYKQCWTSTGNSVVQAE